MSSLRERQRELARRAIVEACAELVTERRHLDFSMREVADRAGVSLRTVYNHFAAREDLLDELAVMVDQQMAAKGGPVTDDLDAGTDILDAVTVNFRLFEEAGGVGEALAQMPLVDIGRDAERVKRTRRIVDHLVSLMPSAPPDDAHTIAVTLRHLLSHRSWFWLTREYGLDTDQVTAVVTWAVRTLIDAAESGDVPSQQEDP